MLGQQLEVHATISSMSDDFEQPTPLDPRPAPGMTRTISDAQGALWVVAERTISFGSAMIDGESKGVAALHFTSGDAHRRLWGYPSSWATLADEELLALLLRAAPVRAFPPAEDEA